MYAHDTTEVKAWPSPASIEVIIKIKTVIVHFSYVDDTMQPIKKKL